MSGLRYLNIILLLLSSCTDLHVKQLVRDAYTSDFDTPIIKIHHLSGKTESIDYPGGILSITYYGFKSDIPVKIKNRHKYQRVAHAELADFLQNKAFAGTKDGEYLQSRMEDAIYLFMYEKVPHPSPQLGRKSMVRSKKKWIACWLADQTYFVVRLFEDETI
ncbi:hypothetical protein JXO59_14485 [candidate division KSB1 bacterium]|nr:hypothetical protein [candidate division KSB1 bacterium]